MKSFIICDPNKELDGELAQSVRMRIGNEECLFAVEDVPYPDLDAEPAEGFVTVKINAFSCNYRDKGWLSHFNDLCVKLAAPGPARYSFFGSDFVGEVVKVGKNVRELKVGDRVMPDHSYPWKRDHAFGGVITNFASKRIQMFRESFLVKVPDSMPDQEAACFSLTALTSNSMISKAQIKAGEKVLVTSMFSNTSVGCLEFLKCMEGIEVYALSTHKEEGEKLAERFNIRHVYSPEELYGEAARSPITFDVVLDPFAELHIESLSRHLSYFSRYISCGLSQTAGVQRDLGTIITNLIMTNAVFIANCLGRPENLQDALASYSRGEYKVHVDSVFRGGEMEAFLNKNFNERHFGKVIYFYD